MVQFNEPSEHHFRLVLRYSAASVRHGERDVVGVVVGAYGEFYESLLGVFAGIRQQVYHHLLESHRVGVYHKALIAGEILYVFHIFQFAGVFHRQYACTAKGYHVAFLRTDRQLAGFDLRYVEDVAYQVEQHVRVLLYHVTELLLLLLLVVVLFKKIRKSHYGIQRSA